MANSAIVKKPTKRKRTMTWFSCNQLSHCSGKYSDTDLSNVVGQYLKGSKYRKQFYTWDVAIRSWSGEALAAAPRAALEAFCCGAGARKGVWSPTPLESWAACSWVQWWEEGHSSYLWWSFSCEGLRGVTEGVVFPRDSHEWCAPAVGGCPEEVAEGGEKTCESELGKLVVQW